MRENCRGPLPFAGAGVLSPRPAVLVRKVNLFGTIPENGNLLIGKDHCSSTNL
jgi:hypothetical protein